jgi:hypothetical protein
LGLKGGVQYRTDRHGHNLRLKKNRGAKAILILTIEG